jgi:hypothetical protein
LDQAAVLVLLRLCGRRPLRSHTHHKPLENLN